MKYQICLSGETAVSQWRAARRVVSQANSATADLPSQTPLLVRLLRNETNGIDLSALPPVSEVAEPPRAILASDVSEARSQGLLHPGLKMEFLVGEAGGRRYVGGSTCRVWGLPLPAGAFHQVGELVLLPSPEFSLLLQAAKLPVTSVAQLVSEFCGYYVPAQTDGEKLDAAPALTSISRINDFLDELLPLCKAQDRPAPRGLARLREATALSADGLASPAEASTFLLLTIARSKGGYGLERPVPNMRLRCANSDYFGDLVWPGCRLVLEYQGWAHEGKGQVARDRRKSNALQAAGYTVLQAGRETLGSLTRCDELAKAIANALGTELPRPTEAFRRRQVSLRQGLLAKR